MINRVVGKVCMVFEGSSCLALEKVLGSSI